MSKRILILVAVVMSCALASTIHADNVGYVDMDKIFSGYKESKKIQADALKKREEFQKMVEEKQRDVEKAKAEKRSDQDIQTMVTKIQEELRPKQEEMVQSEAEIQRKLVSKITEFVKVAAKQYNIDVVIDKRAVFYGGFDLSDFVIEKLNK